MRLHIIHIQEKAARIADKVGILLWEEVPVYWAIVKNHDTYKNAKTS